MNAEETLTGRIVAAAAVGRPIPCGRWSERDWWTSDLAEDRARAAVLCLDCPPDVREACRALADQVKATAGVWGGLDYNDKTNQAWRENKR